MTTIRWRCIASLLLVVCIVQQILLLLYPTALSNCACLLSKDSARSLVTDIADAMVRIDPARHRIFHGDANHDSYKKPVTRVACIIPYIGDSLPAWFESFAFSAHSSSALFDWILIVTDVPQRELPPNFKMIKISYDELYSRLARIDVHSTGSALQETKDNFRAVVDMQPYVLVEFKPCLGFVFSDLIESYSHWAYADLDTLVGRVHSLITPQILNSFDIYTASFGDNYRLYMRGQLTIHRNDPFINNLWMECDHLSGIAGRLRKFKESGFKEWSFQSAEGCYSKVVYTHPNVSKLWNVGGAIVLALFFVFVFEYIDKVYSRK